jgi:recombination protein RecT
MADNKNTQLVKQERDIFVSVMNKVKGFQESGELVFPSDYVPENALKSAQLKLYEVQDKNYKPALDVCTKESIANALLSTVVQGLNPDKKQCYYIVRGNKLCMDRSYFGDAHVAMTVDKTIAEIVPKTVYEEDEIETETVKAKDIVTFHKSNPFKRDKSKIIGAYCNVIYKDGTYYSVIMTFEQIKQSWKQSPMKPINDDGSVKKDSTHDKFTAEMCERTVVRKACTPIINKSSDKNLVAKFARQSAMESAEADVGAEIDENANKEMIDITDASYTVGDAEEEGNSTEDKAEGATGNTPVQDQKDKKQPKKPEAPKNLMDMAEEGPGY